MNSMEILGAAVRDFCEVVLFTVIEMIDFFSGAEGA